MEKKFKKLEERIEGKEIPDRNKKFDYGPSGTNIYTDILKCAPYPWRATGEFGLRLALNISCDDLPRIMIYVEKERRNEWVKYLNGKGATSDDSSDNLWLMMAENLIVSNKDEIHANVVGMEKLKESLWYGKHQAINDLEFQIKKRLPKFYEMLNNDRKKE